MNCLELVSRALRRIGVLAAGRNASATDLNDGLEQLIGIYRRMIVEGTFGELSDVVPTGDYTASENQRITRTTDHVGTITLPETINDSGSVRPPRDLSVVIVSDVLSGETIEYIFDGSNKAWVALCDLTLTSQPPLADRDPIGLICLLAIELADEYGQAPSQFTVTNAARFNMSLSHNWSNPQTISKTVYY